MAQFPIELDRLAAMAGSAEVDFAGVRVYCQIVRFGADDYIRNMASEQEKYEGRLQNRVLPVAMEPARGGCRGRLLLPVHRRLGTQFKMFLVARDSGQARALIETAYFQDAKRNATRRGRRISFTLADVDTIRNIEGTATNNMFYPSNLHDFVRWNSFGAAYLAVQRWRWKYAQWRRRRSGSNARSGDRERPISPPSPPPGPPPGLHPG